jgi:hypothetical protein
LNRVYAANEFDEIAPPEDRLDIDIFAEIHQRGRRVSDRISVAYLLRWRRQYALVLRCALQLCFRATES